MNINIDNDMKAEPIKNHYFDLQKLFVEVEECRRLQKLYFKSKDGNILKACFKAEAAVDKQIELIKTYYDE